MLGDEADAQLTIATSMLRPNLLSTDKALASKSTVARLFVGSDGIATVVSPGQAHVKGSPPTNRFHLGSVFPLRRRLNGTS